MRRVHWCRTLWSFVIQSRPNMPDEIGGLVWFGPDAPIGSVWLPLYASSNNVCICAAYTSWPMRFAIHSVVLRKNKIRIALVHMLSPSGVHGDWECCAFLPLCIQLAG
jgi:hypothetical protein